MKVLPSIFGSNLPGLIVLESFLDEEASTVSTSAIKKILFFKMAILIILKMPTFFNYSKDADVLTCTIILCFSS